MYRSVIHDFTRSLTTPLGLQDQDDLKESRVRLKMPGPTSKFDSLQAQLRANEEEFNQRMGIKPEKKPEPAK